jgi:hypothetical protein
VTGSALIRIPFSVPGDNSNIDLTERTQVWVEESDTLRSNRLVFVMPIIRPVDWTIVSRFRYCTVDMQLRVSRTWYPLGSGAEEFTENEHYVLPRDGVFLGSTFESSWSSPTTEGSLRVYVESLKNTVLKLEHHHNNNDGTFWEHVRLHASELPCIAWDGHRLTFGIEGNRILSSIDYERDSWFYANGYGPAIYRADDNSFIEVSFYE